jgi:hypothetical protein
LRYSNWNRKQATWRAAFLAGHHGFIMLMSAMGVHQVIVCASFHDVHRVRIVSSCAHRFMMCAA